MRVVYLLVFFFYVCCCTEQLSKDLEDENNVVGNDERVKRDTEQQRIKRRKPTRTVDPDVYLEKFGYLGHRPGGVQHSPAARKEAIRNFQRMAGIPVSGSLDDVTRRKMLSPRCGMPDMVPEQSDHRPPDGVAFDPSSTGPQSYYVPGYKWTKTDLSWKTVNYSPDMNWGGQRRAFYNAFKHWSDVSPLTFREINSGDPDIEIKFASRGHGDGPGNEFDGPGNTLAHAFYPEKGDTHFDEDEEWTENVDRGSNLEIVAAHEFGHALGLGHSNIHTALMAPFYQGYDANFKLHNDDIQAIQSLYGPKRRPNPPTVKPTRRPSRPRPTQPSAATTKKPGSKPDTCSVKFDAVMTGHDGRIYVFNGKWMWRLHYWGMEDGFPRLARKYFESPPYSPGAAVYSWRTRYTYFFKGNRVWKYYGFRKIERKTIKTRGYPRSIHAAVIGRDGQIVLMSGSQYWLFDETNLDVASTRGRSITSKFPGIPDNPEAAVRLNDGFLYFFKGRNYRKYDEISRRVVSGYPKAKNAPWFGPKCHPKREYTPK